jgi:hypothetical protein
VLIEPRQCVTPTRSKGVGTQPFDTAGQSTGGDITAFARLALALTAWTALDSRRVHLAIVERSSSGRRRHGGALPQVVDAWGRGWELIPFTLQMSLVIITGHARDLSAHAPGHSRAAGLPRCRLAQRWRSSPLRAGHCLVALGLQSGFSAGSDAGGRQMDDVDYRALAAAAVLGAGIWRRG